MVKRWHRMLNVDDSKQIVTKTDRGRASWPDMSAARMTPNVCRTIAHRENDEVMSKRVRVCVCSWVHMLMCVRLGQSMTMSICSPVSCAKSQECRQNMDTNVHGPIGLAHIYLFLLPWPTYSILTLHFIKFSCVKAITAWKVCTKQNVSTVLVRRVWASLRRHANCKTVLHVWTDVILVTFTLLPYWIKVYCTNRKITFYLNSITSLSSSSCSLPFSHSTGCKFKMMFCGQLVSRLLWTISYKTHRNMHSHRVSWCWHQL